jgi:hypothetical protein
MSLSGFRGSHLLAAIGALAIIALLAIWSPWSAETAADRNAQVGNVAVNCEPGQQALVRQIPAGAASQVSVQCVTTAAAAAMAATEQPLITTVDAYGRVIPAGYAPAGYSGAPGYAPAVYAAPAPVRAVAPRTTTRRTTTAARGDTRSWKKTALVIGGSAGAGAGIGALVGGKKGALIGAAIGGGGATLFEALKRK